MGKYLDNFIKSIPAIQSNQIIRLLKSKISDGEITSVEEYNKELNKLTKLLISGKPIPKSTIYLSEDGQEIDSESLNFMLGRFNEDITALFTEIDNISAVASNHRALIDGSILTDLKTSISSLSSQITKYNLLNRDDLGYSKLLYNDFSITGHLRLTRSDPISYTTMFDRANDQTVSTRYDADEDVLSKTLGLANKVQSYWNIVKASIEYGSTSNISSIRVDIPGLDKIENMLDGQDDTYWVQSTLLERQPTNGVFTNIVLALDGLREVSFIDLDPVPYKDFNISRISYIDKNGAEQTILSDTIQILDETRITFSTIETETIMVQVQQENYSIVNYKYIAGTNIYDLTKVDEETASATDLIAFELQNVASKDLLKLLGSNKPVLQSNVSGLYSYVIGFDNIRAGNTEYENKGIYVSTKLEVDKCTLIALDSKEIHSYLDPGDTFPKGSIEYWIYKVNYDEIGDIIDTESFPIIPVGDTTVDRERLFIKDLTRSGRLRFLADTGETISVYVNEDYTAPLGGGEYNVTTESSGVTEYTKIEIDVSVYNPSAIYTVFYTPEKGDRYLNLNATAKLRDDNVVEFIRGRATYPVYKSDIYLRIMIRSNVFLHNSSSKVSEYKLFAASEDNTRFE